MDISIKLKPQHKATGYGGGLTSPEIEYVKLESTTVEHDSKRYVVLNINGDEKIYLNRTELIKAVRCFERSK